MKKIRNICFGMMVLALCAGISYAAGSVVPRTDAGQDLGTSSKRWGTVYADGWNMAEGSSWANAAVADESGLTNDVVELKSDSTNTILRVEGYEAAFAGIELAADDGDDADDVARIQMTTAGNMNFNGTSGTNTVMILDMSTGDLTIDGDITVSGQDIQLGAAGVKFTDDGDGAVTLLGCGNGDDEDLTINLDDTADAIVLSSSTSADNIIGLASYSLGAAGVKLTGDGDGAITLLGLGDGSDESLTINLDDTADNIVLTSATGASNIVGLANYHLGSAGVALMGDGDGAITFKGLGDGSDEDITINLDDTANTAVVSSGSGVDTLSLTSMGLTAGTVVDVGTWLNLTPASSFSILAGGIITNAGTYQRLTTTGGVTTSTSTAIADGTRDGDICYMVNTSAFDIVVDDGANTDLGGNVTLGGGSNAVLCVLWDATLSNWIKASYESN